VTTDERPNVGAALDEIEELKKRAKVKPIRPRKGLMRDMILANMEEFGKPLVSPFADEDVKRGMPKPPAKPNRPKLRLVK